MKNFVFCLSFIVTHSLCSAMYDAQKIAVEKNVAIRQLRSTTFNDRSSKLCIDKLRKIAKRISANSDRKSIKPEFLVLEMADIQALIHIINELRLYKQNPTVTKKNELLMMVKPLGTDISSIVYSVVK